MFRIHHRRARRSIIALCSLMLVQLLTTTAAAELAVGDPAPEFNLQGSDGKTHRLSDYRGTTVVLAWYPKAFTGG